MRPAAFAPPTPGTSDAAKTASPRKRRRFSTPCGTLLIVVLLASIGMNWIAVRLRQTRMQAQRERIAAETIRKLGGRVIWSNSLWPKWLRNLLDDDPCSIESVMFMYYPVTDADLIHLAELSGLKRLTLESNRVTGTGFEHLRGMSQLETLEIHGHDITDASLAHLKWLPQLRHFKLRRDFVPNCRSKITDAGLAHLKALPQLQSLRIFGMGITDAGLAHLAGLSQLQILDISVTHTTDAGMEHLTGLTQLRSLDLTFTSVTDIGVRRLKQALPNCKIER